MALFDEKIYNCKDCCFANFNKDGSVDCDVKLYLESKMIHIPKESVERIANCASHSSKDIRDTRYGMGFRPLKLSDDTCNICGRRLNLKDTGTYSRLSLEVDGEESSRLIKCKKCKEQGFTIQV